MIKEKLIRQVVNCASAIALLAGVTACTTETNNSKQQIIIAARKVYAQSQEEELNGSHPCPGIPEPLVPDEEINRIITGVPRPLQEHSIIGPPTISAEKIDLILKASRSPAAGTGCVFWELGRRYGIDPAYILAIFIHESSAGTASGWAGRKPDGSTTHNVGNIICAGYKKCYGRFRDYDSWETGINDLYRLLVVEYIGWRGADTIDEIMPIYAPATENNTTGYIDIVKNYVKEWRSQNQQGKTMHPTNVRAQQWNPRQKEGTNYQSSKDNRQRTQMHPNARRLYT